MADDDGAELIKLTIRIYIHGGIIVDLIEMLI